MRKICRKVAKSLGNLCRLALIALVVFGCVMWGGRSADAAAADIQVTAGATTEITVNLGDTGHIQPIADNLTDALGQPLTVARWSYESYDYESEGVVQIDENGNYTALASGSVTVSVYGYSEYGAVVFTGYCRITVIIDMTNVTLAQDQLTGYVAGEGEFSGRIALNSPIVLTEDNSVVEYSEGDSDMGVSCQLVDNELWISTYSAGSATVTVTINGKSFLIHIKVDQLEISKTGFVAAKGKSVSLRVKGTRDKPTWTSSNPGVAKVSRDGTVHCRRTGNAVITAKLGEVRVGCAVSVVSSKLAKVVSTAKKIGGNWKYSQPRRMQTGYYDCSSLVWRAYRKLGKNFGGSSYAPVAADIAKWCAKRRKMVTNSYTWKQVQNMKLRPGDLLFKTGAKNGRYKGIYHVEMFVGYAVSYYDESGTPVLNELWAARAEGYGGGGYPIARP